MKKEAIIYGIHPLFEALETGKSIDKVMLQTGMNRDSASKIITALSQRKVPYQFVPKVKLDRITGKNHQGVIAYSSPVEFQDIEWIIPSIFEAGGTPLILMLDRITDVRNFGAICRSAECAGVHAVIIPAKGAAQINEDAIKTSAGALLRIPICRSHSFSDTIEFLNNSGIHTLACHEKGAASYYESDLSIPLAILMGSEEDGISKNGLRESKASVKIPMKGSTDSLNVSVATAVLLFEALRQRQV